MTPASRLAEAVVAKRKCLRCGDTGRVIATILEDGRNLVRPRDDKVEISCPECILWRGHDAIAAAREGEK